MESLQEIDDIQNDKEEATTPEKEESYAQKIAKRSPINKMLLTVGGVVFASVAIYLFGISKYNEYQKNNAVQVINNSTSVTTDELDKNSDIDIIESEDHIKKAKDAISQQRKNALELGLSDSSSSVSDITTGDDFFSTAIDNSIEGQRTGGQSFSINGDFGQFVIDNEREFNLNDEHEGKTKPSNSVSPKSEKERSSKSEPTDKKSDEKSDGKSDTPSLSKGIFDLAKIRSKAIGDVVASAKKDNDKSSSKRSSSRPVTSKKSSDNESRSQYASSKTSTQGAIFPQKNTSGNKRSKYQLLDEVTGSNSQNNGQFLAESSPSYQQGSSNASNAQQTSKAKSIHGGRGLFLGEKMLGETQHSIISTSETMFLLVEIIQGPLTGAKIVYKPTLNYDTFAFQSSVIQFKGHQSSFNSIIITPDEALSSGYRSGVDYHTLMNLGMVFLSGVAKGSAEFINNVADEIVIGDNQTVTSVTFSTEKLLWAAFGGVADAATPLLDKQLNKPPTVWIDAYDLVGIMMMDNWNAEWSPKIDDNSVGVF